MKITIEGKQGEGKTCMANLIRRAIIIGKMKGVPGILPEATISVYDGDDKPPRKNRPDICIVVKQN